VEQLPILIQDQQWESVLAIVDRYFEGMRGNHVPAELAIEQSLLYHSRCKLLALIHLARHDELLQFVKDFEDRWPSADPVTILFAKFGHFFFQSRLLLFTHVVLPCEIRIGPNCRATLDTHSMLCDLLVSHSSSCRVLAWEYLLR
jgi:hypothetical protein